MNGTKFNPADVRKKVFSGYTIEMFLKEYSFVSSREELQAQLKQSYIRKPQDFRLMWDQLVKNTEGGKGAISMPNKSHKKRKNRNTATNKKVVNLNIAESMDSEKKDTSLLVVNSPTVPVPDTQPTCVAPILNILDNFTKAGMETQKLLNEIKEEAGDEELSSQIEKIIYSDTENNVSKRVWKLRSKIEASTQDIVSFEKDIKSYRQQYRESCKKLEASSNRLQALKKELSDEKEMLEKILAEMPELEKKAAEAVELRKMALSEREELEAELQKALCKRFYCGDSKPSNPDEYDYLLSEIECDANAVNRRATEMFGDLDTYGGLTAIEMLGLAKILSVVESTDTENTNNIEIVMEKTESGLRVAEVLKKLGKKVEVVEVLNK